MENQFNVDPKITELLDDEEFKNHIIDTYIKIINEQLKNDYFSKITQSNATGYKLTLDGPTIKNIAINILEALKEDDDTKDKISTLTGTKLTSKDIENAIEGTKNDKELEEAKLEITVYQEKQQVTQLEVNIDDMLVLQIKKEILDDSQKYVLSAEVSQEDIGQVKIELNADYAGLKALQNVNENYQLSINFENDDDSIDWQCNYQNNIEFTDTVNIEEFNEENCLLLNDLENEQQSNLLQAIAERIQSVNKEQMEEMGLSENENPILYIIPQGLMYSSNAVDMSEMDEMEVASFNTKFENYASTNLKGVTVKGLLSTIQLNNETQEREDRKIKEINYNGEEYEVTEQITSSLKDNIENDAEYRVEFERDENTGVIFRAVINKK